ncbi:tetratricopeptide repeat protein [Alkalinema sp. FACHB-956]|uniref:tetratricopeptide repeat protein n=1 Tax=Alkalinema sp. FACHB-956 TaxID=2692768 RepID=UPI001687F1B4|nr:tetratricopeptide repeat protein [Alkalinema sp. FACHB-956]MBD2325400.1 tetratricopeptide repeat protein [Alkalinema sp. FACHB-956]
MKRFSNTFSASILSLGLGLLPLVGLFIAVDRSMAGDLNRQLAIPLNSGTLNRARKAGDRWLATGDQQQQQGQVTTAIESWQKALELYRQVVDQEAQGLVYRRLAKAYLELGRTVEAEDAARRALGFARTLNDYHNQILGYNDVGLLLMKRDPTEAEKSFAEGVRIATVLKDTPGLGTSLSNWGLAAQAAGQFAVAIERLQKGLPYQRMALDFAGESRSYKGLGDAYLAVGESQKAAGNYISALVLARQSKQHAVAFQALEGLARAYDRLGANNAAIEALLDRVRLAGRTLEPAQVVQALQTIAEYYYQKKDWALTDRVYKQAIQIAEANQLDKDLPQLRKSLENLRNEFYFRRVRQ